MSFASLLPTSMKYIFWTLIGIVCGAALGIILPVGFLFVLVLLEGEEAGQAGTAIAILLILTVPAGAFFGAYAGIHRARTGGWKGLSSPTIGSSVSNVRDIASLERQIAQFGEEVATIPDGQVAGAKLDYVQHLMQQYESTYFNYPLFAAWLLAGLAIRPLLIIPALLIFRHWRLRSSFRRYIQQLSERWLGVSAPASSPTVDQFQISNALQPARF